MPASPHPVNHIGICQVNNTEKVSLMESARREGRTDMPRSLCPGLSIVVLDAVVDRQWHPNRFSISRGSMEG